MPIKKKESISLAERVKLAKSPALDKLLPGGGATKVVKGLTKAEKSFRTKLKQSIRERIEDKEIRSGLEPKNVRMLKQKRKGESTSRKSLRSDVRNLAKIVGDKEAAKFTQAKRASIRGNAPRPSITNPSRAKPRARKLK